MTQNPADISTTESSNEPPMAQQVEGAQTLAKRLTAGGFNLLLLVAVMVMHGLVPGYFFPTLGAALTIMGQAQSLALGSLWSYPAHSGYPLGAPVVLDLPLIYLQAILMRLTTLSALDAFLFAHCFFLILAFFGARELFKQFGIQPYLASLGAALYLTSIFVLGHQGLSPLMLGFALLPLTVLLDKFVRDAFTSSAYSKQRMLMLATVSVAWRVVLLFLDGYTFVISAAFAFALFFSAALQWRRRRDSLFRIITYAAVLGLSFAVSYALYKAYIPSGATYTTMNADFFRAQGVDLATLVLPFNKASQLSSLLGWRWQYQGRQFYGDGSNAFCNYTGIALILAIPGGIHVWRHNRSLLPVVFAAVFCLVLSIGPSLKVFTLREISGPKEQIKASDYFMSPDKPVLNLHTDSFYTKTPGVKLMRAVYRWLIGFKVVLLPLALLAVSVLYRRRYVTIATFLLLLLVLDTLPPIERRFTLYRGVDKAVRRFYADVIPELRNIIPKKSLIIFVSQENDYLSNPIAAALDARSYNVGGDKNWELAWHRWPEEAKAIMQKKDVISLGKRMNARDELDYLIFPHFNLRWNSYWWPPNPQRVDELKKEVRDTIAASDLSGVRVTEGKYATVVDFATPVQQ